MKIGSIIVSVIIGAIACFVLLKSCGNSDTVENNPPNKLEPKHYETFTSDTIFADTVFMEIPVYIKGPVREIPVPFYDSIACKFNRVYNDSLVDSNLVIVYTDSVNGKLLGKKISYKLFVPLKIENTHTIIDSIPYPVKVHKNGWYASGSAGGNKSIINLSLGIDFISKKKISAGISRDFIQNTTNIKVGYRVY